MKNFLYEQATGCMKLIEDSTNVVWMTWGYAGHPPRVNDPSAERIHNIGPIPRGKYKIGHAFRHPLAGPHTARLTPHPLNDMFGRDGFMIHGPGPGEVLSDLNTCRSSEGCIVIQLEPRLFLLEQEVDDLFVV